MCIRDSYNGIMEMLDALLEAGVTLGVLSNKDHAATAPLVAQYFGDRFSVAPVSYTHLTARGEADAFVQSVIGSIESMIAE